MDSEYTLYSETQRSSEKECRNMDNEREQKDRYDEEPVNHVWYEDESTVQQDAEKMQSAAAPPPKPQRPKKQKKKRSAWKRSEEHTSELQSR